MMHRLERRHLSGALAVGLVALLIRLAFVATYPASSLAGHDPEAFWSFAQGITAGQGFRSTMEPWLADRPPLYSYFLAGIFLLFGQSRQAVFAVQAAMGGVAAVLFCLCAVRVMGEHRGLVAGVLFALFPHFLLFTKQILTEPLYLPLLVALLTALLLPDQPACNRRQWLLAGVLLGLVALARREAVLPAALVVALVGYLRIQPNWRALAGAGLCVALAASVTLAPWLIRNWQVLGEPVLSSSSGVNFLVGNNPAANGGYTQPPEWAAQLAGLDELARDRKAWELALGWIRANPDDYVRLLPLKLAVLWGPAHNLVLDGADLALVFFWTLGLGRLVRRREGWPIVAAIALPSIVCVSLIGLVFVGGWRYRLAVYPGLLMLAAYGLPDQWLERVHLALARPKLKEPLHGS